MRLAARARRRAVAWIVMLAILVGAFGAASAQRPGEASAVTADGAICSAHGGVGAANAGAPVDRGPGDTPLGHPAGHCLYCSLHPDTLAPPPSDGGNTPVRQPGAPLPRLSYQAAATLRVWAPSQARAPPAA